MYLPCPHYAAAPLVVAVGSTVPTIDLLPLPIPQSDWRRFVPATRPIATDAPVVHTALRMPQSYGSLAASGPNERTFPSAADLEPR